MRRSLSALSAVLLTVVLLAGSARAAPLPTHVPTAGPRVADLLFRLEHELHALEALLLELDVRLEALERRLDEGDR